jgi:hypothetical protein
MGVHNPADFGTDHQANRGDAEVTGFLVTPKASDCPRKMQNPGVSTGARIGVQDRE